MTTLDEAIAQMRANGMPDFPSGLPRVNTSGIVRYGPKKRAWYRLHEFMGRNGRGYIAGAYGIWGALDPTKIEADWSGMDEAERLRIERLQADREKKEREKRERLADFAARRGRMQYRAALDVGPCPYLERKGVLRDAKLKVMPDGTLLVPVARYDVDPPKLVGLQKIAPDGTKRFNKGMAKAGAACRLGAKPKDGDTVIIVEGVATGLSARQAIDKRLAVVVAFDAGNLELVAKQLRAQLPTSMLIICADDDWKSICDRHQREGAPYPHPFTSDRPAWCSCNPGRHYARRAADTVGQARVVFPVFTQSADRDAKATDFNDLHQAEGLEVVKRQIETVLSDAGALPAAKPTREKKKPEGDPGKFDRALQDWTLIRGTQTVHDASVWDIIRVADLKLSEGEGVVKWWLENKDRRTVWRDDVVFEPAGTDAAKLNLFRGMPVAPDASKRCERVLELLQYLCGEEGQDQAPVTEWILKWCALPLQRLGAKLATSVVMHGADEGAGKNMFWGVVRAIYGTYGGIVTQAELESQFTGWASQKMMLIANEVVSRAELRHQAGRLKNFITEPEVWINEKHLPARQESNHINFVFLSNEVLPQILGHKDRRYCVVHTPEKKPREYYAAIGAEIAAGAAAGLHAYLLALDLGDFDEHAPPPMTAAKERLIDLSKNSAQLFVDEWKAGMLDHPFGPCATRDLHVAYMRWCRRTNERVVMSEKRFLGELAHYLNIPKDCFDRRRVPRGNAGDRPPTSVVIIGKPPESALASKWLDDGVTGFSDSLRAGEMEVSA